MINKVAFKELIDSKYNGNLRLASEDIGLTKSTLSRLLSGQRDMGNKSIRTFNEYCKRNNLVLTDYIFLG